MDEKLLHKMRDLTQAAGHLAMGSFRPGQPTSAEVRYKNGTSPVTQADLDADAFLRRELTALLPEAGWLSEETADDQARLACRRLFVVDPIDGTRAFMSGNPCWAVSVALIEDEEPLLGILYAPALNEIYVARKAYGATLNGELLRAASPDIRPIRAAGPSVWLDRLKGSLEFEHMPKVPSLAYRLAMVARGQIDLGMAGPNSHDWDIAAADLLIREAGACLTNLKDEQPRYNRRETHHGALVAAREPLHNAALIALHQNSDDAITLKPETAG